MEDPSGCCHVGGSVSANVDGVAIKGFSVLGSGCYFL